MSEPERPKSEDESRAHARKRGLQARLQRIQHIAGAARIGIERLDRAADGADGFKQAPEGAEQAQKDQKADQIAGNVAAFIKACCDGIQNGAHRRG